MLLAIPKACCPHAIWYIWWTIDSVARGHKTAAQQGAPSSGLAGQP